MKPLFFKDAVISLAKFNWHSIAGEDVVWKDGFNPPSIEQIKAEATRLESEYDAKQYQRNRASEYPSITEQLDMIYWDKVNGTNNWQTAIDAVKTKFPKD